MSKKLKKSVQPAPPPAEPRGWRWLTTPWGVMVGVGTVVGAVLLNINPILLNVRQLPSEVRKTADQFSSWYHQDTAWSGRWTNNPVGYVDAEDLKLSSERMLVDISVRNGVIDGIISTPQVCDSTPFDFLLVRGKVNPIRKSARVIVWDIFGGRKADIAALDLATDGSVMTVVPREGVVRLFPSQARIAVDPNKSPSEAPFCDGKGEALVNMLEEALRGQKATGQQAKKPATAK